MKLSEHFTLEECIRIDKRLNIDNTPTPKRIEVIKAWCINIADPCRNFIAGRLGAHSVYRCPAYNSSLQGADPFSEHMILSNDSCAGDLDTDIWRVGNNTALFWFIYKNLDFNILIWEFTDDKTGHPKWVHVSHSITSNKKLTLKKVTVEGVTKTLYYNGTNWLPWK